MVNTGLKVITQKKILSATYEFSLLQLISTAKVKERRVKNELLESGYAADKFKSLTASFGMGKLAQKKQTISSFYASSHSFHL